MEAGEYKSRDISMMDRLQELIEYYKVPKIYQIRLCMMILMEGKGEVTPNIMTILDTHKSGGEIYSRKKLLEI